MWEYSVPHDTGCLQKPLHLCPVVCYTLRGTLYPWGCVISCSSIKVLHVSHFAVTTAFTHPSLSFLGTWFSSEFYHLLTGNRTASQEPCARVLGPVVWQIWEPQVPARSLSAVPPRQQAGAVLQSRVPVPGRGWRRCRPCMGL